MPRYIHMVFPENANISIIFGYKEANEKLFSDGAYKVDYKPTNTPTNELSEKIIEALKKCGGVVVDMEKAK